MALLTNAELKRIETKHADGIASGAVVKIFQAKKERFSEATLRKYVQLGLLPTSRRVGIRGRHRGSSGLYPMGVVRLINEIKRGLEQGSSLEQIRGGPLGIACDIEQLQRQVGQLLERIRQAAASAATPTQKAAVKKALVQRKKAFDNEIRQLEKLTGRIGKSGQA